MRISYGKDKMIFLEKTIKQFNLFTGIKQQSG